MRVVSVLSVAGPAVWDELAARVDLAPHLGATLSPLKRIARPSFEKEVLPALRDDGVVVLERLARRPPQVVERARRDLAERVSGLRHDVRQVLYAAQRHALGGVVRGLHAWDPAHDADAVRALYGAGLLRLVSPDETPILGAYRLSDDLPDPPPVAYDFDEAVMDETEDLSPARPGPVRLLHDLAGLAAAIRRHATQRTHAGTVARTAGKRLGRALGDASLAEDGHVEAHPRWGLALRALEALGGVSVDPISRELYVDLGLESTLRGATHEAIDRLVHRLVERDLHVVVPAVRAALHQAGAGAVDEMIFLELCAAQHREILFPRWSRPVGEVYPHLEGEALRPYDDEGWERVEVPMVHTVLRRLERLGLVRRAPGIFAATEPGRVWAQVADRPVPPIWISSDLEVTVPPEALTPGERYDLERLCLCRSRDVVDRYRLDRSSLIDWLAVHSVEEALDLLRSRSPGIPASVRDTLTSWAADAERIVLTRGVLVDSE